MSSSSAISTPRPALARDVAADVAFLVALEDIQPDAERDWRCATWPRSKLRYRITFHAAPGGTSPAHPPASSTIDEALDDVLAQQIGAGRHFRHRAAWATISTSGSM